MRYLKVEPIFLSSYIAPDGFSYCTVDYLCDNLEVWNVYNDFMVESRAVWIMATEDVVSLKLKGYPSTHTAKIIEEYTEEEFENRRYSLKYMGELVG